MELESLFFLTQSIQAIMLSIFFLLLIALLIYSALVIKKTSHKLRHVAEEGLETVEDAKRQIRKIGKTVMYYLMVKILGGNNKKKGKRS